MDVPFELTDIEVQQGFKGYTGKPSTFCHQTGIVGHSVFCQQGIQSVSIVIEILV